MSGFKVRKVEPEKGFRVRKVTQSGDGVISDPEDPYAGAIDPTQEVPEELRGSNASDAAREKYRKYKGMGPVERTVRSGVEQTVRETATAASKIMSLPKRIHAKQQGYLDIGGELKMGEDGRSKLVPYKNKMEDYATEQSLKSSEAEQARMAASSGEGSETLQKYTTGAIRNIGQMAIANLLVPGASMAAGGSRIGAGVGGAIAGKTGAKVLGKVGAGLGGTMGGSLAFGGSRAVSAAREAQEAGLSYEETEKYVKTQVAAEVGIMSLFSAVGAGGLETGFSRSLTSGGARSFLKEIGLNIAGEVAEENITEFVQKVSAIKSGVDKGELTWEVAKGIFAETTMATLFTMGLMEGGRGAVGGARNANALSEMVKNVSEFYGIEPEKAKSILKIASRAETVDEYEQILGNELMLEMGVGDISELTDIAAREDTNLDNEGGSAGYSDIELERELQESKARWERERDAPTAAEPTAAEPTTTEPTPPAPILTQKGTPFQTRGGAVTAARRNGLDRDAVVEVEGGFVVQPPAVETAPTETQTSTEVPIQKPVDLVTGQVLENDDVQNRPLDERVSNDTVVPGEVQAETPAEAIAEPVGTPQAYKPLTATGNQDIATELAAAMPGATITPKGDNSGWTASFASGASVDIPLETNMPTDPLVIKKANPQMSLEQATKYARENKIAAAFVPKGVTIKLADGRTFTAERLTVIFDPRNKNSTTAAHEAIHIARELGFFDTPKGKNLWLSLEKKYRGANDTQTEENIAKARENWEGPGNLWEQILDFLNRIFSKIPGIELSARNAMAETFTPGFWNQQGIMNGEGGTDAAYQVSDNDQRASRVRTPTEVKERARAYLDKTPAPPRSSVPYYDNPDKGRKSKLELGKLQQAKEPLTPVNNNWQLGWSDSAKEEISQTLVHETMRALSENGSGLGWYDRVMAGAMREAKRVFPELRSQDTRAVFTAILSITSNGQKVGPQFRRSYNLFNGYLETEKIEENGSWGGERKVAINSHLQKLNTLLDVFGESGLREFLDSYTTVGQLNKWSRDIFGTNAISGEASDAVVRGAMIFGPKLGNFYANMNGDFSAVTMDLWFSRTIGRITGTYVVVNEEALGDAVAKFEEALEEADTPVPSDLTATLKLASDMVKLNDRRFQKGLDPIQTDEILAAKIVVGNLIGIKEAPSGGYERRQIREVVELTRQKLEAEGVSINAADLQAVLWYYEKQLVARNGGRAALGEANDYEQAAKQAGKTFKRRSGVRKWKRRVPTAAARRSIEQIQLEGAVTEAPTLGLPLPSRPVESQINLTSGTREAGKFLHKVVTENKDGFTIATDGTPRTTGVTVAPLKATEKNYNPKTFTPALATKWLKDNGSLLTTPGAHIGGWLNGKAKKYVIDMSIPMPTREDAVKVAIWADQDAIFDLSTGDTIDTKKDGKPIIPEGVNLTIEQVIAEKPDDVLKWASGRYSDAEAARAMEEKLPKYQLAETQFDKYAQTEGAYKPKGSSKKGMLITHWSFKAGIKKTNPKKNGSGGQGREGRRAIDYPELWVPRTYFGFGDYKREDVIGGVRYGARINPNSLYDFTNDPLDLYPSPEQLEEAGYAPFDEPAGLSIFEQNIKKAGFAGMASDQGVGLLFYPLEVEQVAASDAPVAESEAELPKYQIAGDQAPAKERKARVGLAFKEFFSDVTKGTFGKSEIPFVPNLDMTGSEQVITTLIKHSGNFSDHIFKSIPTFFEAQVGTAQAVSQLGQDTDVRPDPKTVVFTIDGIPYRAPATYLRFGDLPEGPSANWLSGQDTPSFEKGQSVYRAYKNPKTGKYVLMPNAYEESTTGEQIITHEDLASGTRPLYEIEGVEMREVGFDGEPLVQVGTGKVIKEVSRKDVAFFGELDYDLDGNPTKGSINFGKDGAEIDIPEGVELPNVELVEVGKGLWQVRDNDRGGDLIGPVVGPGIKDKTLHSYILDEIESRKRRRSKDAEIKVLDIAGSEGSWGKTVTELSGGRVKTVTLDPNLDMRDTFRKTSKVQGATFAADAFLNGFKDGDRDVKAYKPEDRFDVIHESMGFQFIDNNRAEQITEVKRLMKPDGVFLTEQKLLNDEWEANEEFKNVNHKDKYFTEEELAKKDKRVGFTQSLAESEAVGMVDNMVSLEDYRTLLENEFDYVEMYWDSGNFKGFAASDSQENLQKVTGGIPDLTSEFSTGRGAMYQIADPAPVFYSPLARAVRGLNQGVFTPAQLKGTIQKLPGVKAEELEDLGFFDWLDGIDGKVTKDEVLAFIDAGGPKVEEVVKGNPTEEEKAKEERFNELEQRQRFVTNNPLTDEELQEYFELRDALGDESEGEVGTRYSQYQLPGGENYREMLLTLPETPSLPEGWSVKQTPSGQWGVYTPQGYRLDETYGTEAEATQRGIQEGGKQPSTKGYTSSHWNEPNVLAHVRLNDRTGPNGEKVLFVEEIQSDWHQEGRKKGYGEEWTWEVLEEGPLAIPIRVEEGLEMVDGVFDNEEDAIAFQRKYGGEIRKIKSQSGVPDAPFKKSWAMLAFKRVLRMAAEQGYDSVSWTPGEVQAERYDLSKQIDTLASWPEESATGEPMWGIQAVDENGTVQIERSVMESELEGVVGKEIAQRIIERDGETPSHDESVRELKGEGLKVGGEGMKGFYDNILPKEVQKYVKKMGGKVTTSKLQTGTSQKEIGSGDAEVMGTLGIDSQLGSSPDMQEVWTLPITDEMREEVMGGLPMYQIAGDTTDSYRPDFSVTSIQNDVIRELREMTGRDEIPGTDPETWLMWMEDASVTLAGDPREAERFIADIQENPRVLSPRESAMLTMIHRVAYNEYESVSNRQFKAHEVGDHTMSVKFHQDSVKILNWINEIEEASKRVGSFTGQALNARKIALRQDYSIEALVRKARTSQGGVNLTKDQMDELVEFANRIQDLESRLRQAELSNSDLRRRVDELLKAEVNRPHEKPKAHTRKARAKVKKKKALTDLKSIWEKNGFTFIDEVVVPDGKTASYQTEGTDGTAGPDTNPQFNPEELRPVALQLAEASLEEGAESFGEFWSQVGLHLGDRASLVEDVFRSAWETVTKGDVDPILNSKADITKEARRIQRVLVEEGFWNLDQVVEIVQKALADILPDTISTMEALSGYGQFSLPSQEEAAKIIRDHNAQLLQRVKLDKLKKGKVIAERMWAEGKTNDEIIAVLEEQDLMLKATGPQRDAPSDIVRALNTAVYEAKKAIPVSSKSRSGQLQTAMDSAKKAIGNRIKELDKAIKNGTPLPGRQSTLRADDELKQMRQERDELTRFYREMFPAKKTPITEEQRIEITDRAVTRAIIELERQLAEDDLGPKPKRPSPSSPALDAKRARLEELREQKKLILDARKPKMSPEERAEKTYMTNLKRRIAEYQEILENGDFSPRPKKQKRVLSKEELQMKTELETIRGQVWEKMEEYRLEHSSPAGKALYYAKETAHLSRAMMTSIDASAVFRQGGVAVFSNPLLAVQASKEMAKAFMSQDQEFLSIGKIREDDLGQFAEMVGLSITEDEGKITRQEEAFMGKWAKRVPLVAASGRGYSTFLNNMRFSLFKQIINHLSATGEVTIDEGKVIAKYINAATGRADLKAFNKAAANFNMVFFAPRWVASRFQYLTMPIWVLGSRNVTPRVKRAIAKEYGKTLIGMSTTIGLLLLAGHLLSDDDDEVRFEVNPLSTDFLKVRIGDTRLDPTAALGSTVVFSSRLIAGRTKTRKGDIKKFGEGYKPTTRATLLGQFMRYKMAPIPGAAWTVFDDMTDPVGQKVTPWGLAAGLFIPLSVREVVETSKAQNIPTATMLNALALLGMSIGTYGEQSEFLAADPEERAELFNKKLRTIQWDDPPTGYETELTRKQQQELDNARLRNAGLRAYQLTVEDDAGDPEKSKETRQKALDALRGYNRDLEAALEYYMEERGMRLSSSRRRRLREQMRRIED